MTAFLRFTAKHKDSGSLFMQCAMVERYSVDVACAVEALPKL
jgi:hypothetical protein